MRALVIVQDPGSESVLIGERLGHHGFEIDERLITTSVGDPNGRADASVLGHPDDYDVIVPMGSNYSVYDRATIGSWIDDELDFLRRADALEIPILGICFGGQALAAALGGRVVRSERHQVGWHPLEPTPGSGMPPGPWMQWHYDRFEPPADATVEAVDDVGVQAFTIRRHLGVQFHPEVTADHLARWMDMGGVAELERLGIDADHLLRHTEAIEHDARVRSAALVDWFLADVAKL